MQIEGVALKVEELKEVTALLALEIALKRFNPNQPRWPAGRSEGGQWRPATGSLVAQERIGIYDPARMPGCLAQLSLDEEICRAAASRRCWQSSRDRYDNCMKNLFSPLLEVGR